MISRDGRAMRARRALPLAVVAAASMLALTGACKAPETQLNLVVPPIDGGACETFTSLACVNYVEFSVPTATGFTSHCVKVNVQLTNLCDVTKLADGHELFKLSPETPLPISVEGRRVFPAGSCSGPPACPSKPIFRGSTVAEGHIGDYNGRALDLAINMIAPCGPPEQFFFPPEGGTCAEICGAQSNVICDGVAQGCLCRDPAASGQGAIDTGL